MLSEQERFAAFRRDLERQIPCSTDPAWVRAQIGQHQYSKTFIIAVAFIGFLAGWGIFAAVASI